MLLFEKHFQRMMEEDYSNSDTPGVHCKGVTRSVIVRISNSLKN